MNVLFMTSECFPFAKTGGLADVSEAISVNLVKKGINVTLCLPYYKQVSHQNFRIAGKIEKLEIDPPLECLKTLELTNTAQKNIANQLKFFDILPYKYKGVNVLFFKNDFLFNRDALYGLDDKDYKDNLLRFALFCSASLTFVTDNKFKFDIIHCNDWQTSLVPAFAKFKFKLPSKILLTIHNLGYQGIFPKEQFSCASLNSLLFNIDGFEYYGNINLLKGGIEFSDAVNTVSRKYAEEIKTKEYGFGLDGVLENKKDKLFGILNGVDYDEWNPEIDKHIVKNYSIKNFKTGKKSCKKDLLTVFFGKQFDGALMDKPVISIVSRLEDQKGFPVFMDAIPEIIKRGGVIIVLGTGNKEIENGFKKMAETYPQNISVKIMYDNQISHKIEAGSDFFIMPSKYEPSGLNQMYSLKYGTIPIVHGTGGLDDTIINFDGTNINEADGFKFYGFSAEELLKSVNSALDIYFNDKNTFNKLIENAMEKDFLWSRSIEEYISLYNKIQ